MIGLISCKNALTRKILHWMGCLSFIEHKHWNIHGMKVGTVAQSYTTELYQSSSDWGALYFCLLELNWFVFNQSKCSLVALFKVADSSSVRWLVAGITGPIVEFKLCPIYVEESLRQVKLRLTWARPRSLLLPYLAWPYLFSYVNCFSNKPWMSLNGFNH